MLRIGDWLPQPVRDQLRYARATGRLMRLSRPETFSEKLHWRLAKDRREILAPTCDKLWMKDYAHERLSDLGVVVPHTFWHGQEVTDAVSALSALPKHWVLKPVAGMNARVFFGTMSTTADDLQTLHEAWKLQEARAERRGKPWAYHQARSGYLIEENLDASSDGLADIKIHTFDGKPILIQYISGRWSEHGAAQAILTPDWETIPNTLHIRNSPAPEKPNTLPILLQAAERIGRGFDYMRVDLYSTSERVMFGEITPYPNPGRFVQDSNLDRSLGSAWILPPLDQAPSGC